MEITKIYGFEMSRISEVYLSTLSSFMKVYGLERYYFALLYLCEFEGLVTQKDLAEAIRRDKVYTMRVVDYLSERGFLERKKDKHDRRCQILVVTQKAKEIAPKIKEAINKTDETLFHNFSKEEKQAFRKAMTRLYNTINTLPEPEFVIKAFKKKN